MPCPGNAEALGTARILPVNAAATPRVGRKHFPQTLALAPREVVLTFDDGPASGTTGHVLDALKRECVRASFFLLGRNALAYPDLARRAVSEGHTVAHHTFSHPLLDRMPVIAAEAEIDRGFAAVDAALYGRSDAHAPHAVLPFSRLRLVRRPARPAGAAWHRGFRRGFVGQRLGSDVAATAASSCRWPGRGQSWRNCAVPRYQEADRGDASQLPSFAQERRLSHRACRSRKS